MLYTGHLNKISYEHKLRVCVKNECGLTSLNFTYLYNMKSQLKLFYFALTIALAVVSCKKDDNDKPKNNAITYKGKEYPLDNGYVEYYGRVASTGSYNLDLTVLSSGLVVHEVDGEIDSLSGVGNVIYFEVFGTDPDHLAAGTYKFDPDQTLKAFTFDNGAVGLNLDVVSFTGDDYFFVIDGTLKLKTSATVNEYEVSLNCKNSNGFSVTAYFKGTFLYYNYGDSNMKSASKNRGWLKRNLRIL